jgi:hypothetical protein
MGINLVGSPPPSQAPLKDFLSGNDRWFTSGVGNWVTVNGATVSYETSYRINPYGAGSVKAVVDAEGEGVEVSLSGTFLAGVTYEALVWLQVSSITASGYSYLWVHLGVPGTDAQIGTGPIWTSSPHINQSSPGAWLLTSIMWTPTANRNTAKLRVVVGTGSAVDAMTFEVGHARVYRVTSQGDSRAGAILAPGWVNSTQGPYYTGLYWLGPYGNDGPNLGFDYGGVSLNSTQYANVSVYDYDGGAQGQVTVYAVHTAGDLADAGMQIEVGDDYVGLYISEKDNDTLQIAADDGGGYMMQLRHRGSGKGWAASDDGTVNARIDSFFEWVFTRTGALTAPTTNQCAYFRAGYKCRIDEVQVHVGTAPTGQDLIVDVNDDGATIFTTQGNRPTITAGANDDTSAAADGGTAIAKDSVITIDVDQVGSGTAGSDLTVHVRGRYIW